MMNLNSLIYILQIFSVSLLPTFSCLCVFYCFTEVFNTDTVKCIIFLLSFLFFFFSKECAVFLVEEMLATPEPQASQH